MYFDLELRLRPHWEQGRDQSDPDYICFYIRTASAVKSDNRCTLLQY